DARRRMSEKKVPGAGWVFMVYDLRDRLVMSQDGEQRKQKQWLFTKYDARRRMTHKKVPGADWVYMVYDGRDRLVMTQDGEQRKQKQWLFTKYDALNRPIMTGIYTHNATLDQAGMADLVNTSTTTCGFFETFTGSPAQGNTHGYTNNTFPFFYYTYAALGNVAYPGSFLDVQTVTYYDSYAFAAALGSGYNYVPNDLPAQTANGSTYTQPASANQQVLGLATGTKVKTTDGLLLTTVTYYDDKYRTVQTMSDSPVGGTERTTTIYDFVGKTLATKTTGSGAKLKWKDMLRTQAMGQGLVSHNTNFGNGFTYYTATSVEQLPAGTDGWFEVTVTEVNTSRFIGLESPGGVFTGFQMAGFYLYIYENGLPWGGIGNIVANIQTGDVLRIELAGSTVRYLVNGSVIRTGQMTSSTALTAVARFWTHSSTIGNIRASFAVPAATRTVARRMEYDHAGRLLKTWHSINGAAPVLLSQNEYNEIGQLVDKKLHSTDNGTTFKQSVDYRYNIRGWLTQLNGSDIDAAQADPTNAGEARDLFGMDLLYNSADAGLGNTQLYNGNISAIRWSNNLGLGSEKQNAYSYAYDPMNRLTNASFKVNRNSAWAQPQVKDANNNLVSVNAFFEGNLSYDLNGNILGLTRTDRRLSGNMDALSYTYLGNQLQKVADTGDKTKGFIDGANLGNDCAYDANGNMVLDNNKNISAIAYNHLNLPKQVTKTNGEYLRYSYDATGRKLNQSVYTSANALKKSTDYAGEFFYENDTLKFINHEEGRATMTPPGSAPEYQYHLKDHLGNVRLTFTSKDETDNATATNEVNNAIAEQGKFLHRDKVRSINSILFDHTYDGQPAQPNGTFAQRLSGRDNEKIGLARSLSVMPGDRINIEVFAKYYDPSAGNNPDFANLMNAIISGINIPAGTFVDGAGYGQTTNLPFTPGWAAKDGSGAPPMAYLNWMVFDRNYVQDLGRSGYKRITTDSKETGTNVAHDRLAPDNEIRIAEAGYMYIWLSNENPTPVEVYFDDFKITQTKSPVIQQDDYYPFGLAFNSYQRENSVSNRWKFQGQEHVDD
ncbi:MAG: RHS repeat domain-containing protein, partial [Flammeovirgaceae bacterium]